MTLEVPTYPTALTPYFQHIQLCQLLLRTEPPASSQKESEARPSFSAPIEKIHPMCCVLGADSADLLKKRREISMDWFTESQVTCNLKHFQYTNGGTRAVYCRRKARLQDGRRLRLAPVVVVKKCQARVPQLYVSTTLRFCRAVKSYCAKGNGESVSYWNKTLGDLTRSTFAAGPDMYEEILQTALVGFNRRVNPHSWCNSIPKYLEIEMETVMVEAMELAIKFMDGGIPNAFAVAELLYCPVKKVQNYLKVWTRYLSDKTVHDAMRKKSIEIVGRQMSTYWIKLTQTVLRYAVQRYKGDPQLVEALKKLFDDGGKCVQGPGKVASARQTRLNQGQG